MGQTLRDRSAKGCLRPMESESWIDRESSGCEFRDARLGDRFRKLLTQIGSAMGQSIPLVCQDWANTKAAYRFFSNDRVSEADILAGHFQSTRDRAAATEGLVLVLHDTTEFSYQREKSEAIGVTKSINSGRDKAGRLQVAHGLRHPDAFEPRRDNRRAAAGTGRHQVLDPEEIQGDGCAQERSIRLACPLKRRRVSAGWKPEAIHRTAG